MIETPRKYQASFFSTLEDIKPSTDTIPVFLEMFRDKELLPSIFHELRAGLGGPHARLRLSSSNNEWGIDFGTDRITLQKNMTDATGSNMGTLEEFANQVAEFCKRILRQFPKRGTRLSLVTAGFMREIPEDKLRVIYDHLFHPIEFYAHNAPVEWRSRSVARVKMEINGHEELLNAVTDVNRVQGELVTPDGALVFDRIEVGLDINTFQGNTETRFDIESVRDFYPKALELHHRLLSQVESSVDA